MNWRPGCRFPRGVQERWGILGAWKELPRCPPLPFENFQSGGNQDLYFHLRVGLGCLADTICASFPPKFRLRVWPISWLDYNISPPYNQICFHKHTVLNVIRNTMIAFNSEDQTCYPRGQGAGRGVRAGKQGNQKHQNHRRTRFEQSRDHHLN